MTGSDVDIDKPNTAKLHHNVSMFAFEEGNIFEVVFDTIHNAFTSTAQAINPNIISRAKHFLNLTPFNTQILVD